MIPASGAVPPSSGALVTPGTFAFNSAIPTVLLVTNVVDDSGSIRDYGNAPAIRRGYNESLAAFVADTEPRQIFVSTLLINKGWMYRAKSPKEAPLFDEKNYAPGGGTPLFPAVLAALDFVSQAAEYLTEAGLSVFSITNIITDGADTTGQKPSVVSPRVDQIQASGPHCVGGIAVRDGQTDFHRVFREMGIAEEWIGIFERKTGDIQAGVAHTLSTGSRTSTLNREAWRRSTSQGFGGPPPAAPGSAQPPSHVAGEIIVPPEPTGEKPGIIDAVARTLRRGKV